MIPFLAQIAAAVTKENLPYLYKHCYIFPTKRAALHFTNFLKNRFPDEDFVYPETITIQEFITSYSSYVIKEDWFLLLEIYRIQQALTHTLQPLDKFIPWGKLILKDFDECDKYLVDAQLLFSVLKAQREIDTTIQISEELKTQIERFILTSESTKDNTYKMEFIKTWSLLGDIYTVLQERLQQHHFAYEGMAYREVLAKLKDKSLQLPYDVISFCGFNALSVCEEEILKTIEQQYTTFFWWDVDTLFMKNKLHEAGNFLRSYQQKFSGSNNFWIDENLLAQNKNIQLIGVSSEIGQAQWVAQQLDTKDTTSTAVVLCNERLLTPLLYAINSNQVNITMGYNTTQSELFLCTMGILNLMCNARISKTGISFYHKDIQTISAHSYFKNSITQKKELDTLIPLFVPYMPIDVLKDYFPEALLQTAETATKILKNCIAIIADLQIKDAYFLATKDSLLEQLKQFSELLETLEHETYNMETLVNKEALPFLVKQFIGGTKIPFDTNTDNTIQVMGFLETRILDFDNLYILSLNDDKLPGTNKINSFIPYNLRKVFKLPTYEQFDGINAYHFYRLLKRAKNISLLYNNQSGDDAGEMSRFIRQLQYDLCADKNTITEAIAAFDFAVSTEGSTEWTPIKVLKTEAMKVNLRQRKFSPSALKVHIKCPLQFYLKYVEGINEPEEISEEIDHAVFGQITHKILELIYLPYKNKSLSATEILSFTSVDFLQAQVKIACQELDLPKEITQGSNQLYLKVIERIIQKILTNDSKEVSLQILHLEEKFIWDKLKLADGSFATIQGTFDRVDKINSDTVRITDYKTGKIELPTFPDLSSDDECTKFLDQLFVFDKKDYSAAFQGMLYALMFYKLFDCKKIYVAYHHTKKMKNGLTYLNEQQLIPIELLLLFEKRLSELVSNIIYKEPYFIQSENDKAYDYSAFSWLLS